MIKETRQSYLFILTVLPPLQQLCSPISRSYFKELHSYTILPVMIFIQLLQHTALTCLSHFEDGFLGRMVFALQDFHRIFPQSNLDFKKTHRSIYSINQSQFQRNLFCHHLRALHWRKEKKKIQFPSGCGDKTYHGIKPIKVNAHKTS